MKKNLYRLLVLLIFIFVSALAYLFSPQNNKEFVPEISNPTSTPKINFPPEEIIPAVLKNNQAEETVDKKIQTPPPTTPTTSIPPEQKPEVIPITIVVQDKEYKAEVNPGSSAYTAMDTLKENGLITFSAKNFSGLGYFIEEINGIKNNPQTGFYWTLYINNQEAKIGVSGYIVKSNDVITWKYMKK